MGASRGDVVAEVTTICFRVRHRALARRPSLGWPPASPTSASIQGLRLLRATAASFMVRGLQQLRVRVRRRTKAQ
jgi:hypothetical protein